jgi:hypothetical protein
LASSWLSVKWRSSSCRCCCCCCFEIGSSVISSVEWIVDGWGEQEEWVSCSVVLCVRVFLREERVCVLCVVCCVCMCIDFSRIVHAATTTTTPTPTSWERSSTLS